MKTVAYLRVSTRSQDLSNQKLAILTFSHKRQFSIDEFIESRISSRKSPLERRIDEMLGVLQPGDRLVVSELSPLGRSLGQVVQIVETLARQRLDPGRAFKGLGVAKRYWGYDSNGAKSNAKGCRLVSLAVSVRLRGGPHPS